MVNYLQIKNFAIIRHSEIMFNSGMTTITGETGAGKSILLDALNVLLGARFDKTNLHPSGDTCEISAIFDIETIPAAIQWLETEALNNEPQQCIIRRMIQSDGKSRSFINGQPVTLAQIKDLSQHMISIYGQHVHHSLIEQDVQLERLDAFAGTLPNIQLMSQKFSDMHGLKKQIEQRKQKLALRQTERQLLQYQLNELTEFDLKEDEISELSQEHSHLFGAQDKIQLMQQIADILYDQDDSLIAHIDRIKQLVDKQDDVGFNSLKENLAQASLYLTEACEEARTQQHQFSIDPERLQNIEQRLEQIHSLARKHRVDAGYLYQHIRSLEQKLEELEHEDQHLLELEQQYQQIEKDYYQFAEKISKIRHKAAIEFAKEVEAHLHKLNIPKGCFVVKLKRRQTPSAQGMDHCDFLINFNEGQQLSAISKVASGGELSRIGLAVHVVSAKKIAPPTLIFDEVDVGISGATAEIVGKMLKRISQKAQIICITHQAQVSIYGDQQLKIAKRHEKRQTLTEIIALNEEERIAETARIIGGVNITEQTLAHAKELYQQARQ
ncbi:MAG: DNA repair protein RecN [Francisellaceae bacterium]